MRQRTPTGPMQWASASLAGPPTPVDIPAVMPATPTTTPEPTIPTMVFPFSEQFPDAQVIEYSLTRTVVAAKGYVRNTGVAKPIAGFTPVLLGFPEPASSSPVGGDCSVAELQFLKHQFNSTIRKTFFY